jgi:hypothetical protein
MNSTLQQIYDPDNDIWGLPQTYKNIKFYPLKLKETKYKKLFYKLFCQPKSYIADRDILRMSYLKFILYAVGIDPNDLLDFLYHITQIDRSIIKTFNNEKSHLIHYGRKEIPNVEEEIEKFSLFVYIDDEIFTEQEFDNLREIILEQNATSIEYIESYNPDLEKKLEFMQKNDLDMDLKDEIFSFCALTGLSEIESGEKTLFQFRARFEREVMFKEYSLFKPLEVSGQVTAQNKKDELFKHYLRHIGNSGRYDSIFLNQDKFLEDSGLSNPNSGIIIEK